jgi:hypothetical protein
MDLKHPNMEHKISPEEWEEMHFEGKSYCCLKEGYLLNLKATEFSPERTLSSIGTDNATAITASLTEKFTEVTGQMNDLEMEWAGTDDKLKLETKLTRFKEYLLHVNALGDFNPLFLSLNEKLRDIETLYNNNYQQRLKIIEQAEMLSQPEAETDESKEGTLPAFHDLVEAWKQAPEVRKPQYEALSLRFEKARNDYYEYKRKSQEAWEHELMQNLDRKMEICEKADNLAQSEKWKQVTEDFKTLMEEWKGIGPVPSTEKNEELWQRFSSARNIFFERKKINFEQIQKEQEANLVLKTTLVEKAEALQHQTNWKETAQAFAGIMAEWKKIGKVPFEKATELWQKLQAARDFFFSAKRESAKAYKTSLEDNYSKKQALADRAEALKNATNWHETTLELNEMMQEWKNTGPIPREYGDTVWEKFIAARKYFFGRKDEDREKRKAKFQHQINNRLHQTTQFLDKISAEVREDEEKLSDFKESLQNTTGGSAKEEELRQHLKGLIRQIESQLPGRKEKIEEVKKQKEELTQRCSAINGKKKNEARKEKKDMIATTTYQSDTDEGKVQEE